MSIEVKNIKKSYKKGKTIITVLNEISYRFNNGKIYFIKGKSGSGKSTIIQIMGTLLKADSGEVIIDNKSIKGLSESEIANIRSKQIGFVFQNYYLNPLMTAKENIMLPLFLNKECDIEKRVTELFKIVDLNGREKHFPKELSGGEQQRVAIARAIANNPDNILADEPTGSLDYDNELKILKLLKKLSQNGKCVIIVSHNPVVKKYADVILEIKNHKLIEVKNEKVS